MQPPVFSPCHPITLSPPHAPVAPVSHLQRASPSAPSPPAPSPAPLDCARDAGRRYGARGSAPTSPSGPDPARFAGCSIPLTTVPGLPLAAWMALGQVAL